MATFDELDATTRTELDAAAFRRLLKHLDDNKDVQNIDLQHVRRLAEGRRGEDRSCRGATC